MREIIEDLLAVNNELQTSEQQLRLAQEQLQAAAGAVTVQNGETGTEAMQAISHPLGTSLEKLGDAVQIVAYGRAMIRSYLRSSSGVPIPEGRQHNYAQVFEDFCDNAPIAEHAGELARHRDYITATETYGNVVRAALVTPMPPQTEHRFDGEVACMPDAVRYSIISAALQGMDDEHIHSSAERIRMMLAEGQTDDLLPLRAYVDKLLVQRKMAALGHMEPAGLINQEALFERIVNSDSEFTVHFDELLQLSDMFDPAGPSRNELIARYNRWRADPEGGAKMIPIEDGFAVRTSDLSIGGAGTDPTGKSLKELRELIATYIRTESFYNLADMVGDMLFKRSSDGVKLYEEIAAMGYESQLIENNGQILKAYGLALAAEGRVEEAKAVALLESQKYEDYAYIMLEISKTLAASGEHEKATETLDDLVQVDPVLNFAHNTTPDDHIGMMDGSPTGFIFEVVAERYASLGEYRKALGVYKRSRQYPGQTEKRLAQIAASSDAATHYIRSIVKMKGDDHDLLFMKSRLVVALLEEVDRNTSPGMPSTSDSLLKGYAEDFAQQIWKTFVNKLNPEPFRYRTAMATLRSIDTYMGNVAQVLAAMERQPQPPVIEAETFGKLLTKVLHQGRYKEAIQLYEEYKPRLQSPDSFEDNRFYAAVMGLALIRGDSATFDRFYAEVQDYKRGGVITHMLDMYKDYDLRLPRKVMHDYTRHNVDGNVMVNHQRARDLAGKVAPR